MIRDFNGAIVRPDDPRVVTRYRARSVHPVTIRPRRLGPSVWPRRVWCSCVTCRQPIQGDPRRGGRGVTHDPAYCAAQRVRWHR